MPSSTISGNAYIQILANRQQEDEYIQDFKEIRKVQITEMGDNISFKLLEKRYREHGGVVSDLSYGSLIEETHNIKRLNQKDEVVKNGLMTMEDIYIEAPYDTQLKDEAEYYYRNEKYTILHLDMADKQGKTTFIKAFGRKIPQQISESDVT